MKTLARIFLRGGGVLAVLLWAVLATGLLFESAYGLVDPFEKTVLQAHGRSFRVLDRYGAELRVTINSAGERVLRLGDQERSPWLVKALLAAEDQRFFLHSGVDLVAVLRAASSNLLRGRVVSGASTLTMQLARILERRPRGLRGKVWEALRARQIERALSKAEILAAYMDLVPLGSQLRGFEAASRYWFAKPSADLELAEAAALVAMLPAPSRRAPDRHPRLLQHERGLVLRELLRAGEIDRSQYTVAARSGLSMRRHGFSYRAPHACDLLLRRSLLSAVGNAGELRTGLDLELQGRVEYRVRQAGDFGVDGVAAVLLDRKDGSLRALLGSRDYRKQGLNFAARRRSVGSILKPFLYGIAYDEGIAGPETLLEDRRAQFGNYAPQNFDQHYQGLVRASSALANSRNLPALRLLESLGVDRFRDLLMELGLPIRRRLVHLDLALGTEAFSPLQVARAWQRCFSGARSPLTQAAQEAILASLRRPLPGSGALGLRRSVAWKTGTSSGRRDAWCCAICRDFVLVVWLGNASGRSASALVGAQSAARVAGQILASLP